MAAVLAPCPSCARHVRSTDCVCPFCGTKQACGPRPSGQTRPFSRRAMLAAGALGSAVAMADCESSSQSLYGCFDCAPLDAEVQQDAPSFVTDAGTADHAATDAPDEGSTDAAADETRPDADAADDSSSDG